MLVGCYLINAAAHERQDELAPVLWLVGVFNAYQFLALGVAVWLVRRAGRVGMDARQLLLIVTLFLADTTLVYQELTTAAPLLGGAVAGLALGLTVVQLIVVGRAIGVGLGWRAWAAVGVNLGLVFALPLMYRLAMAGDYRPGSQLVAVWLLAGAVVVNGLVIVRRSGAARAPAWPRWVAGVTHAALWLQVGALGWVYGLSVEILHVPPLMLAAAGLIGWHAESTAARLAAAGVAVAAVVLLVFGMGYRQELWWFVLGTEWSSLRYTLLAVAAGGGWLAWRQRSAVFGVVAAAAFAATCAWASPVDVARAVRWAVEAARGVTRWLWPASLMQWGVALIVAAFTSLAVGAWWSTRAPDGTRGGAGPADDAGGGE